MSSAGKQPPLRRRIASALALLAIAIGAPAVAISRLGSFEGAFAVSPFFWWAFLFPLIFCGVAETSVYMLRATLRRWTNPLSALVFAVGFAPAALLAGGGPTSFVNYLVIAAVALFGFFVPMLMGARIAANEAVQEQVAASSDWVAYLFLAGVVVFVLVNAWVALD